MSVKLPKAREIVRRDAAYFVPLLYGLVPYEDPSIDTVQTTEHMVLLYNPTYIESLSEDELAGVLMHELAHVFKKHIDRFGDILLGDERYLANVAMDIAINPELLSAGWKLPSDALLPKYYGLPEGKTAEWYFQELRKNQKQSQKPSTKEGASSEGSVCAGCCGGIAGNKGKNGENEKKANEETGRDEIEQERMVHAAAESLRNHATMRGRGKIPASLIDMAQKLLEPPKVDWRSALGQVVRKATGRIKSGGKDFSIRRPSKRSFTRGIIRPGLVQQLPEICIIRDTSGSMGQEDINAATIESIGIVRAAGIDTVWYLDADTRVAYQKRIRVSELESLPVHGRGGTDFRPAVEACTKLKPRPDITIYITDGDGCAPSHPPADMEFIWCVIPSYYQRRPANWGHLVIVSEHNVTLSEAMNE